MTSNITVVHQVAFGVLTVLCSWVPAVSQHNPNIKSQKAGPIEISILVEREGPGGLAVQAGPEDLSEDEIEKLSTLVTEEVNKLPHHRVVARSDNVPHVDLSVVVEKIPAHNPEMVWIVASSVISIGARNVHEELLTSNVVAERSLRTVARAVAYYLQAAELTGMLGGIHPK